MDLRAPLTRQQAPLPLRGTILAGIGGAIAVGLLGIASDLSHETLLLAGFGASCVLVFSVPEASFSQPVNVLFGHIVSALCGLLVAQLMPAEWWSIALGVGMSIALMSALRITHPPAGGNPIAVITNGHALSSILPPVLIGAISVVLIGAIYHRATGTKYPI